MYTWTNQSINHLITFVRRKLRALKKTHLITFEQDLLLYYSLLVDNQIIVSQIQLGCGGYIVVEYISVISKQISRQIMIDIMYQRYIVHECIIACINPVFSSIQKSANMTLHMLARSMCQLSLRCASLPPKVSTTSASFLSQYQGQPLLSALLSSNRY